MTPTLTTDLIAYNFNVETLNLISRHDFQTQEFVGQTFMHELARENDVLSAEALMNAGCEIDAADDEGRRPLHEAAASGALDMVKFLTVNGASVNTAIAPFGYTALYYAVERGHADVVRNLLACGASLDARDRLNGQGLLHIAAQQNNMEIAGILIAAGIDVLAEDTRGQTARDHAARGNHRSLEGVLKKVMEHHVRH